MCVCISVYKCVQYASDSLRELTAVCNQQAGSGAWCESYVFQHTSEAEAQGQIKVVPHDLSLLFLPRTSARFIWDSRDEAGRKLRCSRPCGNALIKTGGVISAKSAAYIFRKSIRVGSIELCWVFECAVRWRLDMFRVWSRSCLCTRAMRRMYLTGNWRTLSCSVSQTWLRGFWYTDICLKKKKERKKVKRTSWSSKQLVV